MDNRQLTAWRMLAARALGRFIPAIAGTAASPNDNRVDDLLRTLTNQASRPAGSSPYVGIFGDRPLSDLRQRAGGGVRLFLEHLEGDRLMPADEQADALIRALRGFPLMRPVGVYAYEGLFGYTAARVSGLQLVTWRRLAGQRLEQLVDQISDSVPTSADAEADSLLRALAGQPPRPQGRLPYEGLFVLPRRLGFPQLRARAADTLKLFVEQIDGDRLGSQDAVVDNAIRVIATRRGVVRLPARPFSRLPYEGLFPRLAEVTEAQLRRIAPNASLSRLRRFVGPLNLTMAEFGITRPLQQAHFLAQLAHESGEFRFVEELSDGTQYEGRLDLGNVVPGDGPRFKGRGLIQITGRANYTACGTGLGLGTQLVNQPTRLTEDELAARSAGWFWDSRRLNTLANADDVVAVTRVINGGVNGLADRSVKLADAKRAFGL
ncbi:MAG: glycoside hydrolase family 19 protein [Elainellaceae cyanobacterium]